MDKGKITVLVTIGILFIFYITLSYFTRGKYSPRVKSNMVYTLIFLIIVPILVYKYEDKLFDTVDKSLILTDATLTYGSLERRRVIRPTLPAKIEYLPFASIVYKVDNKKYEKIYYNPDFLLKKYPDRYPDPTKIKVYYDLKDANRMRFSNYNTQAIYAQYGGLVNLIIFIMVIMLSVFISKYPRKKDKKEDIIVDVD
jgi:hypothetical protein